MDDCPHMIKSINTSHIRKKFNKVEGKWKSQCTSCTFKAFENTNQLWCCLQCGNIGCGDQDAQSGDASEHFNKPLSDPHSIVVHVENDSKCWCYECKAEISSTHGHIKEAVQLVKRNVKFSSGMRSNNKTSTLSSVAIPLPPPAPRIPPLTPNEPLSNFSPKFSNSQNNRQNKMANGHNNAVQDKPSGLTNLGNTCFMNSAIQCLASTRWLVPKLEIFGSDQEIKMLVTRTDGDVVTVVNPSESKSMDEEQKTDQEVGVGEEPISTSDVSDLSKPLKITLEIGPETMTGRIRHTIRGIRKFETSKYVDLNDQYSCNSPSSSSSYFNAFRPGEVHEMVAKNFRRGAQHDAHELLRTIVDMMKKDQQKAFRSAIMKNYGIKKGGEGSDPNLVEFVKCLDQKVKHKTYIDEVFGGELMTTQTCLTCDHVKRSHEQFLDLSLPIRVIKHVEESEKKPRSRNFLNSDDRNIVINNSLVDCLRCFTEPELLTGSNVVECENCHKINLAKIEAGMSPDEIFPTLASEKSSSQSSPSSDRKIVSTNSKKEDRKKKRPSRQAKLKNQMNRKNLTDKEETARQQAVDKEITQPGPSSSMTMIIVENHFHSDRKLVGEDPSKKSDGEVSTQSLEDYVVIQSEFSSSGSKRKIVDVDMSDNGENMPEIIHEVELSPTMAVPPSSLFASSKIISESLQNLSVLKLEGDEEELGEDEVDFDLPPAVDGIGGNVSDGEEDNGIPPLDLELPSYDKFGDFQVQVSNTVENEEQEESLEVVAKPGTADEGFSEGENSMSVDNEAQRPSQGPSVSSSRNSLSDSDETSKSSSNDDDNRSTLHSKIPRVTKCPCSRQQSISCPPEFLTIHLKRFQMSNGGYPTKISEHVNYPMILDLTPFCSPDKDEAKKSFDEDGQALYALYGIVEHGGSMNWGHYVAFVKSSEDEKRWFHISDSSVSIVTSKRAASTEAYILFYERIRGADKKQLMSEPSPPPSVCTEVELESEVEKGTDDYPWDSNCNWNDNEEMWDLDDKPTTIEKVVVGYPIQECPDDSWNHISSVLPINEDHPTPEEFQSIQTGSIGSEPEISFEYGIEPEQDFMGGKRFDDTVESVRSQDNSSQEPPENLEETNEKMRQILREIL